LHDSPLGTTGDVLGRERCRRESDDGENDALDGGADVVVLYWVRQFSVIRRTDPRRTARDAIALGDLHGATTPITRT